MTTLGIQGTEYKIRKAHSGDVGLILTKWSKGVAKTNPWSRVPKEVFKPAQRSHINTCLGRAATFVLTPADDNETILGFICFERVYGTLVVHWAWTKDTARGEGVCSALLASTGYLGGDDIVATQWSRDCDSWALDRLATHGSNLTYDPYLIGRPRG